MSEGLSSEEIAEITIYRPRVCEWAEGKSAGSVAGIFGALIATAIVKGKTDPEEAIGVLEASLELVLNGYVDHIITEVKANG